MAVEVHGTLKPKNNRDFPIVEAADVDVNGTRLTEVLGGIGSGEAGVTPKLKVEENDQLYVSYDEGASWNLLGTLPKGNDGHTPEIIDGYWYINGENQNVKAVGEKGEAGNVNINDGTKLKFFAGTQAQYNELSAEEKENLFAIITDDPDDGTLIGRINGFLDGSIPVPTAWDAWHATTADRADSAESAVDEDGNIENIAKTYVRKDTLSPQYAEIFDISGTQEVWRNSEFRVGILPKGKTIRDIMCIGFNMSYVNLNNESDAVTYGFDFSACKVNKSDILNPEDQPDQWNEGVRFQANSICAVDSGANIGVALMSVFLTEKNGDIYAKFAEGFYSPLGGSIRKLHNYVHPLPADRFTISSFCYWFA